ncbi:hypothetical protein VTN31DRAFT_1343 [Thermomyces dupontii]|uniref:uncharacterized protein n=1 Tax=Talaromyces thermophilus TaxID=28565 RepID=UPI0037437007
MVGMTSTRGGGKTDKERPRLLIDGRNSQILIIRCEGGSLNASTGFVERAMGQSGAEVGYLGRPLALITLRQARRVQALPAPTLTRETGYTRSGLARLSTAAPLSESLIGGRPPLWATPAYTVSSAHFLPSVVASEMAITYSRKELGRALAAGLCNHPFHCL